MGDSEGSVTEQLIMRFLRFQSDLHFSSYSAHYYWWKKNTKLMRCFNKYVFSCTRPLRILELGCGDGYFLFRMAEASRGREVTLKGVDLDPLNVAFVRKSAQLKGLTYMIEVIQADIEHLSGMFTPGSFDFIVCSEVVEHLRDPIRGITVMADLLAEGGKAFITTPNDGNNLSKIARSWGLASRQRVTYTPHQEDLGPGAGHISLKGYRQWIDLFRKAGLQVREVTRITLVYAYAWLDKIPLLAGLVVCLDQICEYIFPFPQWAGWTLFVFEKKSAPSS